MPVSIDKDDVYLGVWTNWANGAVRGSTLTMHRADGALLTAFIAIFVGYAGARAWRILCFMTHLALSKDLSQDALYHQRQAILRNTPSADAAVWDLILAAWAWRRLMHRDVLKRLLPLIILGLSVSVAIAAAGVLSSQLSNSMGKEVLLNGHDCAQVIPRNVSSFEVISAINPYYTQQKIEALTRARQCFVPDAKSESCPTLYSSSLPINLTRDDSCPFVSRICMKGFGSIRLDTGYLDSSKHYGLNTKSEHGFKVRQSMHCAPIVTDGYSNISNNRLDPGSGTEIALPAGIKAMSLFYGSSIGALEQHPYPTYEYLVNTTLRGMSMMGRDYVISTAMGLSTSLDNPMSAFLNLIPELSRSDANTELFFLSSNDIQFLNATDDPWFSAHQPNLVEVQEFKDETGESQQVRLASYAADSPISVIGCASSIQVCDSNKPVSIGCSSLQGMPSRWSIDFDRALEAPGTQEQVTLFKAFSSFANLGSQYLSTIVQELGATALQARQSLVVGQQSKLPADQWQIEMRQFFATFLAYQQQLVVDAVAGPAPNLPAEYHLPPGTDGKRMLCKSQKVLSTDYTSFSVLGLSLTFGLGGLLVLISYIMEPTSMWLQRRRKWDNYALIEWTMNDKLHLQASTHEEIGCGTWSEKREAVPVAGATEMLAIVDCNDAANPVWKKSHPTLQRGEFEMKEDFEARHPMP